MTTSIQNDLNLPNLTGAALGPALCIAEPSCAELTARSFDGSGLLEALRAGSSRREGTALFESAGVDPSRPHRTVVVLRAWCRVELAQGQVSLRALVDSAEPLVEKIRVELEEADRGMGRAQALGREDADKLRAPSILDSLRRCASAVVDRTPGALFAPGLFGAFSYEIVDQFERLPARRPDPFADPDASFVLAGDVALYEHDTERLQIVTRGLPWEGERAVQLRHDENVALACSFVGRTVREVLGTEAQPAPATSDVEDATFLSQVREFREAIAAGEIFQGVLSRGLTMRSAARPLEVYRALRSRNPSPYMFFLDLGVDGGGEERGELFGASPETFLKVEGGAVEIRPIAGTVARGLKADGTIDVDLDARLALGLSLDPKELAEHAMLLDLARNDVARVSEPGTTEVVQQLVVEKYSHVQHLVSRVRGRLRAGLDALHAFHATANMGTLSGAPKVRAMELIREAEPNGRGFYGGAAGYLLADGRFDSCIVIRSLRHRAGVYHTRAGAGVVWHSVPESELQETKSKALACRMAVAQAECALEEGQ